MENGADVHAKCTDGSTALHLACRQGHSEVVQWLAEENRADIHAENSNGETPLHVACANDHFEIVKWLALDKGVLIKWVVENMRL